MISFNLHYFFKGPICLLKHSHIPKYWGLELSVQSVSFSRVWLFATPWTAACQASLSITISRNLLKLMPTESVMLSNHLILCHPLLLPPSILRSTMVFSNESVLCIRWPKYWSLKTQILENTIQFIITVIKELDLILNAMGGHGRIAHGVDRVNDFFILPSWVGVCRHYFMSVFLICEV